MLTRNFASPLAAASAVVGFCLFTFTLSSASAAPVAETSYSMGFASDVRGALEPFNIDYQINAHWKTAADLAMHRAVPVIRIENSGTAKITSFTFDLNTDLFLFDAIAIVPDYKSVPVTITSPADLTQNGAKSQFLTINFTNGLAPGEKFLFRAELDKAPGNNTPGTPDFRDVFWNRGTTAESENGFITVNFDNGKSLSTSLLAFLPITKIYPENEQGTSGESVLFSTFGKNKCNCGKNDITYYEIQQVPEPTTSLLGAVALAGLAGFTRRRKA